MTELRPKGASINFELGRQPLELLTQNTCYYVYGYLLHILLVHICIDTPLNTSSAATTANHPQPTLTSTGENTEGLYVLLVHLAVCAFIGSYSDLCY